MLGNETASSMEMVKGSVIFSVIFALIPIYWHDYFN